MFTAEELKAAKKEVLADVKAAVTGLDDSPIPPMESRVMELSTRTRPDTDYNTKTLNGLTVNYALSFLE
jgi:hypothetical protein